MYLRMLRKFVVKVFLIFQKFRCIKTCPVIHINDEFILRNAFYFFYFRQIISFYTSTVCYHHGILIREFKRIFGKIFLEFFGSDDDYEYAEYCQ